MKRIVLLISLFISATAFGQICTLNDASGCVCLEADSTNCYLLPDIKVAKDILLDPTEIVETFGELAISISTPNIGHGPLQILATDYFTCGEDTIYSPGGMGDNCADGIPPSQLIKQLVYRKEGNNMLVEERWAGSMTYHPTHEHMHVDDWGVFSIREKIEGVDPMDSPLVGQGAKIGFCLMDYGTCDFYDGHCVNDDGEIMTSANVANYGLGGGTFSCGLDQGISVGYTDIYGYYLDGMQIPIPMGTCNGDYWLVVEVDPKNNFLEESDENNYMFTEITLSQQTVTPDNVIEINGSTSLCEGESVELTAINGDAYEWSNGLEAQSVSIDKSGSYSVEVTTPCGSVVSEIVEVEVFDGGTPEITTTLEEPLCVGQSVEITAEAENEIHWYDAATGGNLLATGDVFNTEELQETQTFYAEAEKVYEGVETFSEPFDNAFGGGGWNNPFFNGHLIFDVYEAFHLLSVKVFAADEGERTIEIVTADEEVIFSQEYFVVAGENTLDIGTDIPAGMDLIMRTAESPNFFRNNANVSFPYVLGGGLGAITNSSYGDEYYYYFYNWEILSADFFCKGERAEITVEVQVCSDIADVLSIGDISINPNPTNHSVQLNYTAQKAGNLTIQLLDIKGSELQSRQISNQKGTNQLTIDLQQYVSGIYFIEVREGQATYRHKIVKF